MACEAFLKADFSESLLNEARKDESLLYDPEQHEWDVPADFVSGVGLFAQEMTLWMRQAGHSLEGGWVHDDSDPRHVTRVIHPQTGTPRAEIIRRYRRDMEGRVQEVTDIVFDKDPLKKSMFYSMDFTVSSLFGTVELSDERASVFPKDRQDTYVDAFVLLSDVREALRFLVRKYIRSISSEPRVTQRVL